MKSKFTKLLIPIALSISTTFPLYLKITNILLY